MKPKVIAVIVNYNKPFDTLCAITAIINNSFSTSQIIVVDNASTDDSVAILKKNQHIQLIKNKINTGGSGGFNRGMQEALSKDADYVWLLDDDAYPDKDYLKFAIDTFNRYPDTGIVGPQLLSTDDNDMIVELGAYINWQHISTLPIARNQKRIHEPLILTVEYTAACCMLVSRQTLETIGLFNENYFLHWDDIEFGYRANQNGFKVRINSQAIAFHKPYDQIAPPHIRYYDMRNSLHFYLFAAKHWGMKWRVLSHHIVWTLITSIFSQRPLDIYILYKALWDLITGNMGKLNNDSAWHVKLNKDKTYILSHHLALTERIVIANNLIIQGYSFEILTNTMQETAQLTRFPVRQINTSYINLFFRYFFSKKILISTGYYQTLDLCFRQRTYFDGQSLIKKPLSLTILYNLIMAKESS